MSCVTNRARTLCSQATLKILIEIKHIDLFIVEMLRTSFKNGEPFFNAEIHLRFQYSCASLAFVVKDVIGVINSKSYRG